MLQSFSDRIRNSRWLGYLIVGLISIPFALWGIQSYVGGGSTTAAAEVNGERIPVFQVQQMASQQRQQMRERFGGELPEAFGDRIFREQALNQLIDRELLRQAAADGGFRVTDTILRRSIREQEMFRRDGSFDSELYRRILSRSGLSPQQYEADVRGGYRIEQLRRGIADSGFVLPGEARESARLTREERDLSLLVHPRAAAEAAVEVGDEDLRAYYEEHQSEFQTPPQVRVAYVELDVETLRSQVDVSEEDLRAEYRADREQYAGQQEREAAHILLEIDNEAGPDAEEQALETARELHARLQEGADFAELARQYSQDPGSAEQGGRLGTISRGSMVESFEEALFALEEEGAVSEPVRTPYGYHLIKLLDIRGSEERRSFEDVRDEIEQEVRGRRAERLFYDRVEVLRNTAYEQPGSLEPVADVTGLEIRRSDWFSRASGEGIAGNEAVRAAAFSTEVREERLNSELIELGQRRVVVLRVDEERPARPKPYEDVRAEVEQRLRNERTERRLSEWVEETLARLDEGAAPSSLAEGPVRLQDRGWVARTAEDIDRVVQATAFDLPVPGGDEITHAAAELQNGDRAVVIVRGARLPEVGDEAVAQARQQQLRAVISAEIGAYLAALREEAEIIRNEEALEP